jgi:hypothetical protein
VPCTLLSNATTFMMTPKKVKFPFATKRKALNYSPKGLKNL